jgi:hypothetical protein
MMLIFQLQACGDESKGESKVKVASGIEKNILIQLDILVSRIIHVAKLCYWRINQLCYLLVPGVAYQVPGSL